jgi:nucleotide-binding universal stress UspA family protein
LLVPLDGSDTAEHALVPAAGLAAACEAEMVLMRVVPTVGTVSGDESATTRLLPTTTAAMLEVEASEAATYLERVAGGMRSQGRGVTTAVGRGDPVRALAEAARQREVNLIVMATHGRSGVSAVWAGSVASRLAGTSVTPILLIRIPAA